MISFLGNEILIKKEWEKESRFLRAFQLGIIYLFWKPRISNRMITSAF